MAGAGALPLLAEQAADMTDCIEFILFRQMLPLQQYYQSRVNMVNYIPEFCMKLLDFDIKKKKSPG